jgi:hypothetical protein
MLVIPALRRLRKEDWQVKATLSYIWRPCLKKQTKQTFRKGIKRKKKNSGKEWDNHIGEMG